MGHMFSNCLLPLAQVCSSAKPPRYKGRSKTIYSAHHCPRVNLNNLPCLCSLSKTVNPTPVQTYPQGRMPLGSKYKYSWPFSSFVDSAIINLPTCSDVPVTPKLVLRALIDSCGHVQSRKKNVRIRLVSLTKVKYGDVLSPYFRSSKQVFS